MGFTRDRSLRYKRQQAVKKIRFNVPSRQSRYSRCPSGPMDISESICFSSFDSSSNSNQEDKGGPSKYNPDCPILAKETMVFPAQSHAHLGSVDSPRGSGSSLPGALQPPSCEGSTVDSLEFERQLLKLRGFSDKRSEPVQIPQIPLWNINLVLEALTGHPFEPLDSAHIKCISLKTALLVALVSARRYKTCTRHAKTNDVVLKPSGSLIASTQSKPNKHDVVFFEKNGLLHGEFTLPFGKGDVQVKELLWNSDSTVLAAWLQDIEKDGSKPNNYVQLWVVGNYHWYLKQSLHFGSEENRRVVSVAWDPEISYRLHVVCCGWQYLCYDWTWCTDRSGGQGSGGQTDVAVIDGDKVLVTSFGQSVVPPPMCTFHMHFPHGVNEVSFHPDPDKSSDFAVLDADNSLYICRYGIEIVKDCNVKAVPGSGHKLNTKMPVLEKQYSTYYIHYVK
ncbi:unnamed protein product [Ranitomeya imitator]|uniref:IkappaB kinase complex-associated protein n=1 Tax=Ranitomeya imitator TaxID=111125 RepID=A0ABN9LKW7_9NEOB|nr:unnamed protein product [Ranitomeya imitator]